jgi:SAM-dependent methyltransferase
MSQIRDYSAVSEAPGVRVTREAAAMLAHRYAYSGRLSEGKDVLELACGAGLGLGYLADRARRVVGGDYTVSMLRSAQRHYQGRVSLVQLDAHNLPFAAATFDVVLLLEAIYYLSNPRACIRECRRVMRPGGILLISTVNKEWKGFSPSGLSLNYLSARELREVLHAEGFDTEILGAFPDTPSTWGQKITAGVRRLAARCDLVPKTMKSKELLKWLFYGRLVVLGPELNPDAVPCDGAKPVAPDQACGSYKILYAVAANRHPASANA